MQKFTNCTQATAVRQV